jgi:hypothetical protein
MGWKTLKEHYGIRHLVQVKTHIDGLDGDRFIVIGTTSMYDLIVIRCSDGKIVKANTFCNNVLQDYLNKMGRDGRAIVKELIDTEDCFNEDKLMDVYVIEEYEGRKRIVLKRAEKFGWPNVTTDGMLMSSSNSFKTKDDAVKELLRVSKLDAKKLATGFLDAYKTAFDKRLALYKEIWNYLFTMLISRYKIIKK